MNQSNQPGSRKSDFRFRQGQRQRRNATPGWINTRHWGFDARRDGGRANSYVDRYEARLLAPAVLIMLCSVLDAFLTQELIRGGAEEVNYLMASLMQQGPELFVKGKVALTGLSIVFLVVHKNFYVVRSVTVTHVLYFLAAIYLALIGYEAMLLGQMGL